MEKTVNSRTEQGKWNLESDATGKQSCEFTRIASCQPRYTAQSAGECDLKRLLVFHTTSLRRIYRILGPSSISNQELLEHCQREDMKTTLKKRRWRWVGHVLRREPDSIARVAIYCIPRGKIKRDWPKTTWRRTVEEEMKTTYETWGAI